MVSFGVRLRLLRNSKHWTQEQLANQLGLTKSVISAYEMEERFPSYGTLAKISMIFAVSTDYLLGLDDKKRIDVSDLSDENFKLVLGLVNALKKKQ